MQRSILLGWLEWSPPGCQPCEWGHCGWWAALDSLCWPLTFSKCLPHHIQAWAMLASTQAVPMWCTTSQTSTKVWIDFTYYHISKFSICYDLTILSFWALLFLGSIPSVGRREKASSGSPGSWSTFRLWYSAFYIWEIIMIPDDPTPPHTDNTFINLILPSTNFSYCSSPRSSHLFCYKSSLQPAYWRRGEILTRP